MSEINPSPDNNNQNQKNESDVTPNTTDTDSTPLLGSVPAITLDPLNEFYFSIDVSAHHKIEMPDTPATKTEVQLPEELSTATEQFSKIALPEKLNLTSLEGDFTKEDVEKLFDSKEHLAKGLKDITTTLQAVGDVIRNEEISLQTVEANQIGSVALKRTLNSLQEQLQKNSESVSTLSTCFDATLTQELNAAFALTEKFCSDTLKLFAFSTPENGATETKTDKEEVATDLADCSINDGADAVGYRTGQGASQPVIPPSPSPTYDINSPSAINHRDTLLSMLESASKIENESGFKTALLRSERTLTGLTPEQANERIEQKIDAAGIEQYQRTAQELDETIEDLTLAKARLEAHQGENRWLHNLKSLARFASLGLVNTKPFYGTLEKHFTNQSERLENKYSELVDAQNRAGKILVQDRLADMVYTYDDTLPRILIDYSLPYDSETKYIQSIPSFSDLSALLVSNIAGDGTTVTTDDHVIRLSRHREPLEQGTHSHTDRDTLEFYRYNDSRVSIVLNGEVRGKIHNGEVARLAMKFNQVGATTLGGLLPIITGVQGPSHGDTLQVIHPPL